MGHKARSLHRFSAQALNIGCDFEIDQLLTWANSKTLQPLYIQNTQGELRTFERDAFVDNIKKRLSEGREIFIIRKVRAVVGSVTIALNVPESTWKSEVTAWLGLVVGDAKHRQQGIGSFALRFAEKRAKRMGATCLEVGVFEFNKNALAFFRRNGFGLHRVQKSSTFWDGKACSAYHLIKHI